ncbi:hypothetical protein AB0B28_18795 [Glycomyces sp. NPDC046736]|uniref:hypothetical protein n=1 Tax=Glycomyces sp. NPDC046736 TaxID=3155615 RepID=UPI0033F5DAC2
MVAVAKEQDVYPTVSFFLGHPGVVTWATRAVRADMRAAELGLVVAVDLLERGNRAVWRVAASLAEKEKCPIVADWKLLSVGTHQYLVPSGD